jgi:hypothetical protein
VGGKPVAAKRPGIPRGPESRGRCDRSPGATAAASGPPTSSRTGADAAGVPPSAATGATVEPVRANSGVQAFSGPASGVAGGRGDDLAGVQRTERSGVRGTPVSSPSGLVVHAQREGSKSPRSPGTGTGRCRQPCRQSRPLPRIPAVRPCDEGEALIAATASEPARPPGRSPAASCAPTAWSLAASPREGWQPDRVETLGLRQRLDAQRNSPAPRSGDTSGHCVFCTTMKALIAATSRNDDLPSHRQPCAPYSPFNGVGCLSSC